jgi:hypothetical protein
MVLHLLADIVQPVDTAFHNALPAQILVTLYVNPFISLLSVEMRQGIGG